MNKQVTIDVIFQLQIVSYIINVHFSNLSKAERGRPKADRAKRHKFFFVKRTRIFKMSYKMQSNWGTVNFFSPCTWFSTLHSVQASFGSKLINVMQRLKSICSRIVCCKLGYVCSSTIWKYFSREHIACLCNHLSDRKIALLTPDCKTSFACLLAAEKVFLKLLSLTGFSALIVKMIKRSFSYRLAWLLRLLSLMVFVLYLGKSHTD